VSVTFFEHNIPNHIPADVSLCLFRVLEEAVTNVTRHSGAHEASVTLDFDGQISLRVLDKGRGMGNAGRLGLGLVSMRERIEALGGTLAITSRPGRGTFLHARVPLPDVSIEARQSAETA
jgi:signal transduction histidine kinase